MACTNIATILSRIWYGLTVVRRRHQHMIRDSTVFLVVTNGYTHAVFVWVETSSTHSHTLTHSWWGFEFAVNLTAPILTAFVDRQPNSTDLLVDWAVVPLHSYDQWTWLYFWNRMHDNTLGFIFYQRRIQLISFLV